MNSSHASAPNSHDFSQPSSPPPNRGRPSTYTPAKVTAVCAFIRATGVSDTAAGAMAGVSRAALSRWKQEEQVEIDLGQARVQYLLPRLAAIGETRLRDGRLDWRAQAWLIKFASPEEYGPPSRRRRLEKIELPPEEEEQPAAPEAEMEGGAESVTFCSEIPARPSDSDADCQDVAGAPPNQTDASEGCSGHQEGESADPSDFPEAEPREGSQNVTIRSEIHRDAAGSQPSEGGERPDASEQNTTKCPETPNTQAPSAMAGATPRLSRRARRAEQRQQAGDAWREARHQRAA